MAAEEAPGVWLQESPSAAGQCSCESCASAWSRELGRWYGEGWSVDGPVPASEAFAIERRWWDTERMFRRWAARIGQWREAVRPLPAFRVGLRWRPSAPAGLGARLARRVDRMSLPCPTRVAGRSRLGSLELLLTGLSPARPLNVLVDPSDASPEAGIFDTFWAASVRAQAEVGPDASDIQRQNVARAQAELESWRQAGPSADGLESLGDVVVFYDPLCDALLDGIHGASVRATCEALFRAGIAYRVSSSVPSGVEPLILADAAALSERTQSLIDHRIRQGLTAIVVGTWGAVDDLGRPLRNAGPLRRDVDPGLHVIGSGAAVVVDPTAWSSVPADRRSEPLAAALDQALEGLRAGGRRSLRVEGPPLVLKPLLQPDQRLELRVIDVSGGPQHSGATVRFATALTGGARHGLWMSHGVAPQRIAFQARGLDSVLQIPAFRTAGCLVVGRR